VCPLSFIVCFCSLVSTSYCRVLRISVKWSRSWIGFEISSHPVSIRRGNNMLYVVKQTISWPGTSHPTAESLPLNFFRMLFFAPTFIFVVWHVYFNVKSSIHCYTYIRYSGVSAVCSNCIIYLCSLWTFLSWPIYYLTWSYIDFVLIIGNCRNQHY